MKTNQYLYSVNKGAKLEDNERIFVTGSLDASGYSKKLDAIKIDITDPIVINDFVELKKAMMERRVLEKNDGKFFVADDYSLGIKFQDKEDADLLFSNLKIETEKQKVLRRGLAYNCVESI